MTQIMMTQKLILACWIVFLAYWLINAPFTKKTVERTSLSAFAAYRIPFTLGALLLFLPASLSPANVLVVPVTLLMKTFSCGLCVMGLLGAIWSRRTLANNWSSEVVFKERHELVERGPYRFIRHPIYTSLLLMALGTALASGRPITLVGFLLIIAGLCVKIKQEEELMLRHFPAQYAAYKSRAKALIPFVW